jgi:hypothetical protein
MCGARYTAAKSGYEIRQNNKFSKALKCNVGKGCYERIGYNTILMILNSKK